MILEDHTEPMVTQIIQILHSYKLHTMKF